MLKRQKEMSSFDLAVIGAGEAGIAAALQANRLCPYTSGFIKLLFEPGTLRLLGGHIVGSDAAEIIHALALALRLGATAQDFAHSVYHHPSLSEGFREAARDALGRAGRA